MNDYQVGDTIQWTRVVEGKIESISSDGALYLGEKISVRPDRGKIEVIKRATPPEPTEPGTVVNAGRLYMLTNWDGKAWTDNDAGRWHSWDDITSNGHPLKVVYTPGGEV